MREPRLRRPGMLPDRRACLVLIATAAGGFLLWLALAAAIVWVAGR